MVPCPKCTQPVSADAKFCPNCGQQIGGKKKCAACNAEVEAGAKFCPECGKAV